ncbi:hypothetical protein [Nitrococcus mobilis]|uniref:Uncharacterized protein n=1 Tax=Nitrococcus mobilis Nb-231 TaxID=314278 RepID=A4BTS1_9GAMM|nr:hypothetical protein [Nitrococcus mobilis]EAR20885.1 hypothetical protein NB231_03882 [Nitrococcus mobilis Nb-231]
MRPIAADNNSWMAHFDPVKLDLAVVLLVALGTTFVIVRLDAPHWLEFLIVAAVGLGSGGWLALHTRRVVRAAEAQALEPMHERPGRDDDP